MARTSSGITRLLSSVVLLTAFLFPFFGPFIYPAALFAQENEATESDASAATPADIAPPLPSLDQLPVALREWLPWVEGRDPGRLCPQRDGAPVCVWPGVARYEILDHGAKFSLSVKLFAESTVPLPSQADLPLHDVQVFAEDGKPVTARYAAGPQGMALQLPAGSFVVRGSFSWGEDPDSLPLPGLYGLVSMAKAGAPELRLAREGDSVRIVDAEREEVSDALTLQVMRRLNDASPAELATRLVFRVSGAARSIRLGKVLPANALPVSVESNLPLQLQRDGSVAVQLVPGEHQVTIHSVIAQPLTSLTLPTPDVPAWPQEETFVWTQDGLLRSVEVQGPAPLSAELSQLPSEWAGGAAYVAQRGSTITFHELSRGELRPQASAVRLQRELWLDLDGGGYTVRDTFTGTLGAEDRLNALGETHVGRASEGGNPLLIAPDPKSKALGVEIRNTTLNLEAVSRVDQASALSAVGWDHVAESLSLSLWLPPSWDLLWVGGAGSMAQSWWNSWTLLDVFLAMLMSVGAYQLFGAVPAALTGAVLVMNHGQFLAPRMLFVHVMLLAVWRLVIHSKEGLWHRLCALLLFVSYAAWTLQSLAFMKLQVTQLLYPQLQAGTRYRTVLQELLALFEGSFLVWPYVLFLLGFAFLALRSVFSAPTWSRMVVRGFGWGILAVFVVGFSASLLAGSFFLLGGSSGRSQRYDGQYEEQWADLTTSNVAVPQSAAPVRSKKFAEANAVAANQVFSYQDKVFLAGPALPEWRWRKHMIQVDGPVGSEHQLSLVLLSPGQMRFLSLLRIVCMAALLIAVFRRLGYSLPERLPVTPATAAAALALSLLVPWRPAFADIPSLTVLEELEHRIEAHRCKAEHCAGISEAHLKLSEQKFELLLSVMSQGRGTVIIPGPMSVMRPVEVAIDGKPTVALRRNAENFLEVQVDDGVSRITVRGVLPESTAFAMQLPDHPQFAEVSAESWFVEGISPSGAASESVRFTNRARERGGNSLQAGTANLELPSWTSVSRSMQVGDQISLTTTVQRIGSTDRAVAVAVPLLETERLTSEGVRAEGGKALLTIPAGSDSATYSSALPYASTVKLHAQPMEHLSEEWTVACAPIVHCELGGLPPSESVMNGQLRAHWLPFPGEDATVEIQQLSGIPGDFMTVDSVHHRVNWGPNLLEGTVNASVRVTQQQSLVTTLPPGAEVKSVQVEPPAPGSPGSVGSVTVLLNPGSHRVTISYTMTQQPATTEYTPPISFNVPVHNVTIELNPGDTRWLLWTGGVAWGPAVVFWSKLFFLTLITVFAASRGVLPVGTFGAVMLAVGLTTLPLVALAIPLGWLALLQVWPAARSRMKALPGWLEISGVVFLTLLALASFYRIVQIGLVLHPPMLIAGNQSHAHALRWFVDHAEQGLPRPWVVTLSLVWWRGVALFWSTWLVIAVIRWLKRTVEVVKGAMD